MATVNGITAARAQEIADASVVSGHVNSANGHLILVTAGGTQIDAGLIQDISDLTETVDLLINPPLFSGFAGTASAQSIPNGTTPATAINLGGTETVDTHTMHDNTQPSKVFAPIDGYYELSGAVGFAANGTGYRYIRWAKNGSDLNQQIVWPAVNANIRYLAPQPIVSLVAGDYIELRVGQNSGAALNTIFASPNLSEINVKWLRPL